MRTIAIYADGDLERLGELRLNVAIAERDAEEAKTEARRYGDDVTAETQKITEAKAEYDAFLDVAAERADAWVVDHIGHAEFRDLVKAHPVRKIDGEPGPDGSPTKVTHPDDEPFGVNVETFAKALLLYVDPEDPEIRTIKEPTENVPRLVKRLSVGQFETLWIAAYQENVGGPMDPKVTRFSTAPTSSAT